MKRTILQPGQSYTNSRYFDLPFQAEDIWVLNREQRQIIQDLSLYRVPDDLEDLQRILINILL